MNRSTTVNLMIGLAFLVGAAAAQQPIDLFQQNIVSHTQGWGVPGTGVAAHAPDKEPMRMRIDATEYTSGLGTHAPSVTVVMLEGQYRSFSADAGVQWQETGPGSVVMRVELDGKEVFNSGTMKGTDSAKHVDLPVTGAGELRLYVDNANDGIENDLANWANATLTPDPDATKVSLADAVDMALFATVMTWDPAQIEGTKATRLETMPEEDLFPGTALRPDVDGVYSLPPYADGRGSIGLEWIERRRVSQVSVEFAEARDNVPGAEWQYWKRTDRAGSRWQGSWAPIKGEETREGATWTVKPTWENASESRGGVLKIRCVFPASSMPVRVNALHAYTLTRWREADLLIQSDQSGDGAFTVYNGAQVGSSNSRVEWNLQDPLRVRVRYCPGRLWELTDRTIIRFALPKGAFGVAVDDVVNNGSVYVEHAGLLVSLADKASTLEEYRQSTLSKSTLLDKVRAMPDQTAAQAMRHVHRADGDLGPTLLSLAADNRKFLVQREGEISFDRRRERYDVFEKPVYEPFACLVKPAFGSGPHDFVTRSFQSDWLPVQVLTVSNGGVEYKQRTFVAPYGEEASQGTLAWVQHRVLGVAEFSMLNRGNEPADAMLSIQFMANAPAGVAADVAEHDGQFIVSKDGVTIAVVTSPDWKGLSVTTESGSVHIAGSLAAKSEARCVVFMPHWEAASSADLVGVPDPDLLASQTEAYWRRIMEPAMHVEVPDALFNKLIPASQMHCLMAARNEDADRVAPWIASWHYGPLESEGHSILRGMAYCGHPDFTRRGLEYYIARYNDQGFLTTGYTVMGTGWHLWMLGEFYTLTRDKTWLRQHAPAIEKVCQWIINERRKTMRTDDKGNRVPEYGLMPPGVGADWEVYSYYFYLNGYYCAGLSAAAGALADIEWEGAQAMVSDAAAFRDDIVRAYHFVQSQAPVFPLRDGTWVPEYPTHALSPMPIEFLYPGEDVGRSWCYDVELGAHHLIPMGILPADGPDSTWIMDHMEDVQFLRPGWFYYEDAKKNEADWFNLGGFAKVQPYYARTGEVYALRDEVKPFLRTYFNSVMSLLNREDLSLWEHFMNGAYNKTHETGYFLHQTRLMLVHERGNELWLAPFVTNNWMREGMRVAMRNAPTAFGQVDYTITSHVDQDYMEATIVPPTRQAPEAIVIRLRHPEGRRMAYVSATGGESHTFDTEEETVRLIPKGEEIRIRAHFSP
ncbi:MAG: hypothetical protein AMXMBFR84_38850 [Candidatus Hydrogenedentota bacterium]